MITAKCPTCGATIEVDETQSQFCTNCGTPVAVNAASNIKTTNTASTSEATANTSGFDRLVSQYYSYVNKYDIDFQAIMHLCWLQAEVRQWQEQVGLSTTQLKLQIAYAEEGRQTYNQSAERYNNTDIFINEAEERRMRESANTWRDEYNRKLRNAEDAKKQLEKDIATTKHRINDLEKYQKELYNTALKVTAQAFNTVQEMLKKYPNNPLGYLYMADFYRREAMWRLDFYKKAMDYVLGNYDELEPNTLRLYDIINEGVEDKENYELSLEYFNKAAPHLSSAMCAANVEAYNATKEFLQKFNRIVSDTKDELKRIENHHDDVWKKQERAKNRKKWRNTLIILAILAAIGVALYFFVIKQ